LLLAGKAQPKGTWWTHEVTIRSMLKAAHGQLQQQEEQEKMGLHSLHFPEASAETL